MCKIQELYSKIKLDFDASKTSTQEKVQNDSHTVFNQLASMLCPNISLSDSESENIVSNYIFIMDAIRNDLSEIEKRLDLLKTLDQGTPKDNEYEHKRLRHFSRINIQAKEDILQYITNNLSQTLMECKGYKFIDRQDDQLSMLFLNFRYDYSLFKRYYDFEYDFATEVKFKFMPGVDLLNEAKIIEEQIELRKNNPTAFAEKIDKIVSENDCINYIYRAIKNHFYLAKRAEIFDTLVNLYHTEKYSSFIALAIPQLEGLFYDCLTIINKKELGSRAGTLVEKADKVFSENEKIKQALYPYFAFDVPILRNEIAHNGLSSTDDPRHLSNEIILDINCILHWACHLSNEKFIAINMAYVEATKNHSSDENQTEYEIVFNELFRNYYVCDHEYLHVLAKPEEYINEIDFIKGLSEDPSDITIKEQIEYISTMIKSADFWNYMNNKILSEPHTHTPGKPYDIIDFIITLRNIFIPVLPNNSDAKIACKEVSKSLKAYDIK